MRGFVTAVKINKSYLLTCNISETNQKVFPSVSSNLKITNCDNHFVCVLAKLNCLCRISFVISESPFRGC